MMNKTRRMMKMFATIKTYFDLNQAYIELAGEEYHPYSHNDFTWFDLISDNWENSPLIKDVSSLKAHVVELLDNIMVRYGSHYIGYVGNANDVSEILKLVRGFWENVQFIISMTYDKYATLLNIYSTNLSKLMDGIKSTQSSTSRYNDTPQESGEYDDEDHTTSLTIGSGESTTEGASKIARIKEIQTSFDNVMLEWVKEFDRLFIEEGNVR